MLSESVSSEKISSTLRWRNHFLNSSGHDNIATTKVDADATEAQTD